MKTFGILGYPLGHSFSKRYFTEKFERENINSCFHNFEIDDIEKFPKIIKDNPDLQGLSVTIPYKTKVLAYVDSIDEAVQEIGASNCLRIKNKTITAFNTDHIGFTKSLAPLLENHHTSALVLGNGGAAKAVVYALRKLGIEVHTAARNPQPNEVLWNNPLTKLIAKHKLIINTTPLGTFPNTDYPHIDFNKITTEHLAYDLVYNPEKTSFLAKAEQKGAQTCNGYKMLQLQAEAAWKIWNA